MWLLCLVSDFVVFVGACAPASYARVLCVLFTQCRQACPGQPLQQTTPHLHLHCLHCPELTDHTETLGSHTHRWEIHTHNQVVLIDLLQSFLLLIKEHVE